LRSGKFATDFHLCSFETKGLSVANLLLLYFNKVKKEITKLLFLAVNFFQSEDTLIVAYFSYDVTSFEHGGKRSSPCNLRGFFTHKYCGLIFCFAKPLTRKCSAKILRLRVAK